MELRVHLFVTRRMYVCALLAYVMSDIHCVSKYVPPLTCYNLDIHDPIAIIFGRSEVSRV